MQSAYWIRFKPKHFNQISISLLILNVSQDFLNDISLKPTAFSTPQIINMDCHQTMSTISVIPIKQFWLVTTNKALDPKIPGSLLHACAKFAKDHLPHRHVFSFHITFGTLNSSRVSLNVSLSIGFP